MVPPARTRTVDLLITNRESKIKKINNITFTVHRDDLKKAIAVTQSISDELGGEGVRFDDKVTKLSIVGVGMISKPGVAAQLFRVLGQHSINIRLISTSEIKVSCVIDEKDGRRVLELVHDELETLAKKDDVEPLPLVPTICMDSIFF